MTAPDAYPYHPTQPISPAPLVPYAAGGYGPVVQQQIMPAYPSGVTYGPTYHGIIPPRPASQIATWALVMGVVGLFLGACLFGIPNLLAVVLGHAGVSETKDGARSGHGMAVTGLVLGYVTVLPSVLAFVYFTVGMLAA
jgi:hypothetical protein